MNRQQTELEHFMVGLVRRNPGEETVSQPFSAVESLGDLKLSTRQ